MSDQPQKKQTFSFHFKRAEEEARFIARVKELGTTTSDLARELICMGLDGELSGAESPAPGTPTGPSAREIKETIIKAAWATAVVLSPDLDEAAVADYLRGLFGEWE